VNRLASRRFFVRSILAAPLCLVGLTGLTGLFSLPIVTHADSPSPAISANATPLKMEVWKTPTCGCCQAWVTYLEDNGFEVVAHDLPDVTPIKVSLGLTDAKLHSCHTGKIGGYVVEGHVPVSDIKRMLTEKPEIVGLTAPGMPMYSPGMASIVPRDYDVLEVAPSQKTKVFSSY